MGLGDVLATYLNFGEVLLGQPAPRLRQPPRTGAIAAFSRIIEPPPLQPWKQLRTIMISYIAARCQDPRGILNLLDLKAWPNRSIRFTRAFKRKPPHGD